MHICASGLGVGLLCLAACQSIDISSTVLSLGLQLAFRGRYTGGFTNEETSRQEREGGRATCGVEEDQMQKAYCLPGSSRTSSLDDD